MTTFFRTAIITLLSLSASVFADLLPGVYELEGSNPGSDKINYRGTVTIQPLGHNYSLTWKIGSQVQHGIGVLKDHILSVAFYNDYKKISGVVSYVVIDSQRLEGTWACLSSQRFGREWLTFKSP